MIAGEYNNFLFNTTYKPLFPLKEAAIVQSMHQNFEIQFTAESRRVSVFMMHDLLNKWSRYSSLEMHVSSVSCAFMQNMLLACTCLIFLNKAMLLRQNIDDAWTRSRFN